MGRSKNASDLPLPTIGFEVTEGGFLPVALSIAPTLMGFGLGRIGDEEPGFSLADLPNDMDSGLHPARFLENLAVSAPLLTWTIDQMAQAAFLTV